MSLVAKADALLAFVDAYEALPSNQNRRFDVAQFEALDLAVYVEADKLNRLNQLSQRDASDFNGPVTFLGKTNLPGNWLVSIVGETEPHFCPIITRRWREDLRALRALSVTEPKSRTGRPRKDETDKTHLVVAALAKHHQYESDGSIGNYEPAIVRQLAAENTSLSTAAISRFLHDKFGDGQKGVGHKRYAAACRRSEIGRLLAQWQADVSEGHHDLRPEESGRRDD